MELDGAASRLGQVEATAEDVERRVGRAIGTLRDVLARTEPAESD
jgi:hypothetical protein